MSTAAHALHYALVLGGLVGVAYLLVPRAAAVPRSAHEQRVADLRYTASAGLLGTGALLTEPRVRRPQPVWSRTLLPVAVVASGAAAGVHAAVAPGHLAEGPLIGAFFIGSSTFQLAWAGLALRRTTRSRLLLGAAANAGFIAQWALSRTVGLPLTGVEPVGPWDLAAVVWEAAIVVTCLAGHSRAVPSYVGWSAAARAWLVVSVLALGMLSITGAGA